MAKYVKKQIIIDAEEYKLGLEDGIDNITTAISNGLNINNYDRPLGKNEAPYISTLEGKHYISLGDYIITGVKRERYPCKKDIFLKTYDLVT